MHRIALAEERRRLRREPTGGSRLGRPNRHRRDRAFAGVLAPKRPARSVLRQSYGRTILRQVRSRRGDALRRSAGLVRTEIAARGARELAP